MFKLLERRSENPLFTQSACPSACQHRFILDLRFLHPSSLGRSHFSQFHPRFTASALLTVKTIGSLNTLKENRPILSVLPVHNHWLGGPVFVSPAPSYFYDCGDTRCSQVHTLTPSLPSAGSLPHQKRNKSRQDWVSSRLRLNSKCTPHFLQQIFRETFL